MLYVYTYLCISFLEKNLQKISAKCIEYIPLF